MTIDATRIARDRALIEAYRTGPLLAPPHDRDIIRVACDIWPIYMDEIERLSAENARLRTGLDAVVRVLSVSLLARQPLGMSTLRAMFDTLNDILNGEAQP